MENLQEEVEVSYDVRSLTEDNTKLRLEVERLKEESSLALEEAKSLSGQLKMQQTMYSELNIDVLEGLPDTPTPRHIYMLEQMSRTSLMWISSNVVVQYLRIQIWTFQRRASWTPFNLSLGRTSTMPMWTPAHPT